MKFGVMLGRLNPARWREVTVRADELGFESVWIAEHLVLPAGTEESSVGPGEHPPIPAATPVYDAFAYLCFLAAATTRIRLGTYVYNLALRDPFTAARSVQTLDIVSNGRAELGVGAGWLRGEWEAAGIDFSSRGGRLDEAIEVCRKLWAEPVIEYHGRHFDFGPVMFEPKPPTQLRVHVGGQSKPALRRAARFGDGWMAMDHTLESLPPFLADLDTLLADCGRSRSELEITVHAHVADRDDIKRWGVLGVDRIIIAPWQRSAEAVESLERFAELAS